MVKGHKKGQLSSHCKYGHEFTEDNIIYRKRDRGRGEEVSRICKICHAARGKKYRIKPGVREWFNAYVKEWRLTHKDYVKSSKLKSCFGISLEEFNLMLKEQNGKCLICGKQQGDKYFAVDHNHTTGKIRGLLCSRCNRSLGWYEKCKEGIESYLNKTDEKRNNRS